jgi:DNA-binding transcriptional ArsR family regulator
MMLEALFGNRTAEQVLMYLAVNESAYAQQMADALSIPLSVVQKQLRRLELGGLLVSRLIGRTRLFSINARLSVANELKALLKRAFAMLPDSAQLPYESYRTRPRLTGKPLQLKKSSPADSNETTL